MVKGWRRCTKKEKERAKKNSRDYYKKNSDRIIQKHKEYILRCNQIDKKIEKMVDIYLEGIASSDKELVK